MGAKPAVLSRRCNHRIAFIGINLVIGLMWGSLSGVVKHGHQHGIQRDVVDVGWPSAAAIAFGSSVGLWLSRLR